MTQPFKIPARPLARLACLAGLALLVGCVASPDKRVLQVLNQEGIGRRYQGDVFSDEYVTIGDTLTFRDTYNPSIGGSERVGIDGTINVEPIGRIWIAGMTLEEAEVHLTEKAAAYFTQSDVQVSLKTGAKSYFIFGEVGGSGGRKPLNRDLTLFEAVMDAKPSQNSANLGRVRLIRADPVEPLVITANLGQILTVGDTTFNPVILEDDIIVVPPTMLAQVGYFVSDLVYPFTTVFQTVFQGLFKLNSLGNKLNNNNQNNLF